MNSSITTWVLAGALAASLAWNAKGWFADAPAPTRQDCSAMPDLSRLDLTAEQTRALEAWCANACESGCSMDREAELKLEALHTALRDPEATADSLRALGAEVSRLRAHSLDACVESIVEVRRVLTKDQLGTLMECCAQQPDSKP